MFKINKKVETKEVVKKQLTYGDVMSIVDKKVNQVTEKIKKSYFDGIKENETNLKTSNGLVNFLLKTSGYKLYKIEREIERGLLFSNFSEIWTDCILNNTKLQAEEISVDKLQTLGKYESFKNGETTYIIAKAPKTKKKASK